MDKSKADLILHPIRMRIIQSLVSGQRQTTQQLAERNASIPQATLYRHLNTLLKAGLLEVVEERKNRGTVEKVYGLAMNGADLTPDDLTETSSEQHMELFLKFVASLIGDFGAYVGQDRYHMRQDGISFRQHQLYLNEEEYLGLLNGMREQMKEHAGNKPADGRRLRTISTIVIPETRKGQQSADKRETGDESDS
ncbi:helix-turn-helix domain-containing protein [Cohnella faecalis]|uniref:ArsR family transcriptional regulator n=1 Tax=Cohnella faecalis TaxID=2315694 RepID=A0A398CS10_9BACL|nr:helix-turn-helix domain-containing protein [Cohnella faecalis]RIE01724.1 ArsR family transcriptional regulator [Cohnella faecalis]